MGISPVNAPFVDQSYSSLVAPTITIYEVFKVVLKESSENSGPTGIATDGQAHNVRIVAKTPWLLIPGIWVVVTERRSRKVGDLCPLRLGIPNAGMITSDRLVADRLALPLCSKLSVFT